MKKFIKAICLVLSLVFVLSLAACHPKGEVAVTAGDYEITSAMYSYYLVMADSEAKGIINDNKDIDKTAKDFSYYAQKIGDKPFVDYVKELALNNCLKHITYEKLSAENKITLTDTDKTNASNQANYYWNYYGYGAVYEANGISYDTYTKIMENSALATAYFNSIYDTDGTNPVKAEELQKSLDENYAAAYLLTKDYSSEQNPDVAKLKEEFEGYKTRLLSGEEFKKIYNEFNKIKEEEKDETEDADKTEEEKEDTTPAPKDSYISILGSDKTNAYFDKFDDVKKMEVGTCEIISDEDNKVIYLVFKKDINEDSYYRDEYLKADLLYLVKGDEFDAEIDKAAKALEYTVNNFAINQFKVKKIDDGSGYAY